MSGYAYSDSEDSLVESVFSFHLHMAFSDLIHGAGQIQQAS